MISPFAAHRILKHFNAIDTAVSGKLLYKRPRDEEDLTKSLVDALDEECQEQEQIDYSLKKLQIDLIENGEPVGVMVSIDTHSYTKQWERYVSQADIGLVIRYENNYERRLSRTWSWLLQAKRLFAIKGTHNEYSSNCTFESFDHAQHERIKRLQSYLGSDFFRYLYYCPRPEKLDEMVKQELSYRRSKALQNKIFDFTYGLELRDDLKHGSPTVAAGIYVSAVEPFFPSLGDIHSKIFNGATPFSWFLFQHVLGENTHQEDEVAPTIYNSNNQTAEGLVSGNNAVISDIMKNLEEKELNLKVLPSATITITISQGSEGGDGID